MSNTQKLIAAVIACVILGIGAFLGAKDLQAFNSANNSVNSSANSIQEIEQLPAPSEKYPSDSC